MGEEEQRCKSEEGGEKRAEGKTEGMQRGESGGRGGRHARSQMSGLISVAQPKPCPWNLMATLNPPSLKPTSVWAWPQSLQQTDCKELYKASIGLSAVSLSSSFFFKSNLINKKTIVPHLQSLPLFNSPIIASLTARLPELSHRDTFQSSKTSQSLF